MDQTLVTAVDLRDQPETKYILIIGGASRPNYYAVDGFDFPIGTKIAVFRRDGEIVYMCRRDEGMWALTLRSAVNIVTKEDMVRHSMQDADATNKKLQEIDPKAYAQAVDMLKDQGVTLNGYEKPTPGQYI